MSYQTNLTLRRDANSSDLDNSVRLLDETIRQGIDSLEMLDSQGRQINRIGTLEDSINRDVQDSKQLLNRINHYFYSSTKVFRPSYWKKNKHQKPNNSNHRVRRVNSLSNNLSPSLSHSLIKQEAERLEEEGGLETEEEYLQETENDRFVEKLHPRIAILKEIAMLQGNHLDNHNQKLETINQNLDYTQDDINELNKNIRKKF